MQSSCDFIFLSAACPAVQNVSILSHKRHNLRRGGGGKLLEHKMCFFIFSTTLVWKVSHSKKNSARYCHKCISIFMYGTILYCTVLYSSLLYFIVQYSTALYCTVLYCTVLYCTLLYCALFLSDFTETWIFVDKFSKSTQILNFIKIRSVVTELFHVNGRKDGRTERRKYVHAYIHTYIHTHTHTHTHTQTHTHTHDEADSRFPQFSE
jgi:hypothetical protein